MRRLQGDNGQTGAAPYVIGTAVVVGGIVFFIWLIMFIMGWGSAPVDQVGLHYSGGPFEGQKFEKIIEPGSGAKFLGLRDKLVKLPVTQREYQACVSEDKNRCDGPPIVTPAKGGVDMRFDVGAFFTIKTGGEADIRKFYERICIKYDCTSTGGWDNLLNNAVRKPIESALRRQISQYTIDQIYAGEGQEGETELLTQIQEDIAAALRENVNRILGGEYLCGPTYDRAKKDCPEFEFQITDATPTNEAVIKAFAANAASRQAVITAKNNADAEVAEAEGKRRAQKALAGLYSDPTYVAYLRALALQECAKRTGCTLVVTDGSGTNVNVPARG